MRGALAPRLVRAAALGAALVALAPAGRAAADALPSGSIGLVTGVRQGVGATSSTFGLGALWGVEAGYQPMSTSQRVGWAVRWRVLFSGYLSGQSDNLAGNLRAVEVDGGTGLRIAPRPGLLRYLDVGAGVSLLRSNIPLLPPSRQRAYLGPYVSVGLEQYVGSQVITFELRVGVLGTGPTTLSAIAGIKWGV
ncbi:MAG: hypothetical protein K8W52_26745 [Deltaproteobacteria bacterium]|nr:hypothetical protein [Deltaproteobacteria bacterium]